MAGIEINTAIGATTATITCSYTTVDNTTASTMPITIGGTGNSVAGRFILLPLRPGCTGVSSVNSLQLSNSTATAGAFSVVLYKPLFMIPISDCNNEVCDYLSGSFVGALNPISSNTFFMLLSMSAAGDNRLFGSLLINEE